MTWLVAYPAGKTGSSFVALESVYYSRVRLFTNQHLQSIHLESNVNFPGSSFVKSCYNLTNVYYAGTEEQWIMIDIDIYWNDLLDTVTVHYGATAPDIP